MRIYHQFKMGNTNSGNNIIEPFMSYKDVLNHHFSERTNWQTYATNSEMFKEILDEGIENWSNLPAKEISKLVKGLDLETLLSCQLVFNKQFQEVRVPPVTLDALLSLIEGNKQRVSALLDYLDQNGWNCLIELSERFGIHNGVYTILDLLLDHLGNNQSLDQTVMIYVLYYLPVLDYDHTSALGEKLKKYVDKRIQSCCRNVRVRNQQIIEIYNLLRDSIEQSVTSQYYIDTINELIKYLWS